MRTTCIVIATVIIGAALVSAGSTLSPAYTAGNGYGSTAGYLTSASFKRPWGVSYDITGSRLIIADYYAQTVRAIDSSSFYVSYFAGSTTGSISNTGSTNGQGTAARFYNPVGCSVSSAGTVYIVDSYNNQIRHISTIGYVTLLAGTTSSGTTDGTGSSARFYRPAGVAVASTTMLYVADSANNKIRSITVSTGAVTTLAGAGASGSSDGTGTAASFYSPYGVAAYSTTTVFVADTYNHRVRKIVLSTGAVTTLAGSSYGYTDASGTAALFRYPYDLSVDYTETVYVMDSSNDDSGAGGHQGTTVGPVVRRDKKEEKM
jgi:hypothetical protein